MTDGSRILLVEDDDLLAREIVHALERDHWLIDHVGSLGEAFEAIIQFPYRVILLDRRLPDGDGIGLIPAVKSRASPPSIIFLTARDDVVDRVEGLDAGADDYLVKPFALQELLARLRAACRRPSQASRPALIEVARLSYDPGTREVRVGHRPIAVPRLELALLELLVRRASRVVQRGHLEMELYGLDQEVSANALDALISRLRRRLQEQDAGVELRLVRGVGYMLRSC